METHCKTFSVKLFARYRGKRKRWRVNTKNFQRPPSMNLSSELRAPGKSVECDLWKIRERTGEILPVCIESAPLSEYTECQEWLRVLTGMNNRLKNLAGKITPLSFAKKYLRRFVQLELNNLRREKGKFFITVWFYVRCFSHFGRKFSLSGLSKFYWHYLKMKLQKTVERKFAKVIFSVIKCELADSHKSLWIYWIWN